MLAANVSTERRNGREVTYLPLYMLPLVGRELSKDSLDGVVFEPPSWGQSLRAVPYVKRFVFKNKVRSLTLFFQQGEERMLDRPRDT